MKRIFAAAVLAVLVLGAFAILAPAPATAGPPCVRCPLVPEPSDCPPCYEYVPQTCRQCAHCERIKGCQT